MSAQRPRLFDSHAHLVADDQTRYPRNVMPRNPNAPPRLPGTVGRPGGFHGQEPIHEVPDVSRMLKWMTEENVAGGVAVQKRLIYRYDNSYILDSCDAHVDTFLPMVILDAQDEATPDTLRRWTVEHGLCGVRIFGFRQPDGTTPWLDSPEALRTWEAAQELGIPVDLEVICREGGAVAIPQVLALAERFPEIPIVLDHMLEPHVTDPGFGLDERHAELAANRAIFYKFTSINLDILRESGVDAAAFLRRAVDLFGASQIMWGSDIGTSSGTYKDMVQRALDSMSLLNEEERQRICSGTAQRVFVRGGALNDPLRTGRGADTATPR